MKYFLFLACFSLIAFGCSKNESGDSTSTVEATKITEAVVTTEMPTNPVVAESVTSNDDELNDQQILDIKSAFFQVEQRINKEVGLEFSIEGNNVRSSISKRCESTDSQEIKDCLISIRKSLEEFVREGGAVLGESNPSSFRSEFVKISLANDWLRKINKNIIMAR